MSVVGGVSHHWAARYYSQILIFYLTMWEILIFENSFLSYKQRNLNFHHVGVFSLTHPGSLEMPLLRRSPVFGRVKLPWKALFSMLAVNICKA